MYTKMSYKEELKTDVLLIIEDYKRTFADAPTLGDLIENDLEFEKLSQHLLVMKLESHYTGYTIVEQNSGVYTAWILQTTQPKFKKEIRSFWKENPRILVATKNMAEGTALLTNLLGTVTSNQLVLLHEIFFGKETPEIRF